MKYLLVVTIFLSTKVIVSGQIQNGSKLWMTGFSNFGITTSKSKSTSSIAPANETKSATYSLNPEIIFGRISNNKFLGFGVSALFSYVDQTNAADLPTWGIAPVVVMEKFIPITNNIYYSPISRLSIGYTHATQAQTNTTSGSVQKTISGSFSIHPFSLTIVKNQKTNFYFTLSRIGLDFNRTVSHFVPQLANSKTVSSNVVLNGNINSIGFGIQKTF